MHGDVSVDRLMQTGRVDLPGGARIGVSAEAALLLKLLRRELDRLLVLKATHPDADLGVAGRAVVDVLRRVLR